MTDPDHRLADAVLAIVDDVQRGITHAVVVARGVQRIRLLTFDTDERPAERIRRENASALLEMAAIGNSREAARKVARRRSRDPHTMTMLAQRFRRLRRKMK
jgi:hypothetical protein